MQAQTYTPRFGQAEMQEAEQLSDDRLIPEEEEAKTSRTWQTGGRLGELIDTRCGDDEHAQVRSERMDDRFYTVVRYGSLALVVIVMSWVISVSDRSMILSASFCQLSLRASAIILVFGAPLLRAIWSRIFRPSPRR
jgi:hypothetical protein